MKQGMEELRNGVLGASCLLIDQVTGAILQVRGLAHDLVRYQGMSPR